MKADHKQIKHLLNTAKGQIDGLLKMVENDEYCINISNQLLATIAILKKTNLEILNAHLHCCVLNADTNEKESKMNEISQILKKVL